MRDVNARAFLRLVETRALEMWRKRELSLQPRLRRMEPDDMDRATGVWLKVMMEAATAVGHELLAEGLKIKAKEMEASQAILEETA